MTCMSFNWNLNGLVLTKLQSKFYRTDVDSTLVDSHYMLSYRCVIYHIHIVWCQQKTIAHILNPDLKVLSQAVPLSIIAKAIISWWHHDMGMLSSFYIGGILWTKSNWHLWISLKKEKNAEL